MTEVMLRPPASAASALPVVVGATVDGASIHPDTNSPTRQPTHKHRVTPDHMTQAQGDTMRHALAALHTAHCTLHCPARAPRCACSARLHSLHTLHYTRCLSWPHAAHASAVAELSSVHDRQAHSAPPPCGAATGAAVFKLK